MKFYLVNFLVIWSLWNFSLGYSKDDFHLKVCYPWFHPSASEQERVLNCTLGCSLLTPHISVGGSGQQEIALCLEDGRTGIQCTSDSDCESIMEIAQCTPAFCRCKEKGLDRFYSPLEGLADTTLNFCTASSEPHGIHQLFSFFPWKILMILFGIIALTGLLLITLKWLVPIIRTIRDYHSPVSAVRIISEDVSANAQGRALAEQDKPPPYETALRVEDPLPSYEDVQKYCPASVNYLNADLQTSSSINTISTATPVPISPNSSGSSTGSTEPLLLPNQSYSPSNCNAGTNAVS